MADKNRNGIDDALERKLPGYATGTPAFAATAPRAPGVAPYADPFGLSARPAQPAPPRGVGGQRALSPTLLSLITPQADQTPNNVSRPGVQGGTARPVNPSLMPQTDPFGADAFSKYLAQAAQILGGGGSISYDPQRETARANAADADARLAAMYRELGDSVVADGTMVQEGYDQAIQNSQNSTVAAQEQVQAAAAAAMNQQAEVLGNLGVGDAQGGIIAQGQDLASQAVDQVSDAATRGDAAGQLLAAQQGSAAEYNGGIATAVGLEGVDRQAQNQAALASLLAQIDMEEQTQNAALQQGYQQQQLSLADVLRGYDYSQYQNQNQMQQQAAEQANALQIAQLENQPAPNPVESVAAFIQQLDSAGYIDWANMDASQQAALLNAFAKFQ